jgi:biotin synthase
MNDETQALCYLAGANSIFLGEKLLTTGNPDIEEDMNLMKRLGLHPMHPDEARRIHRGELAPADAKPAEWPSVAEFAAANVAEESCGTGGCGCK